MCLCLLFFFFFKQKTAYEVRISDWSSDVCSSDLVKDIPARIRRLWPFRNRPRPRTARRRSIEVDAAAPQIVLRDLSRGRSEERRVGKECVSPCSSRWPPYH